MSMPDALLCSGLHPDDGMGHRQSKTFAEPHALLVKVTRSRFLLLE